MRQGFAVPATGRGYPDNAGIPRGALEAALNSVDIIGGSPWGRAWFLNGNKSGGEGVGSRDNPFKTMAAVLAEMASGDTLFFKGNVTENIIAPAGLFNITILGGGTRPRHADAHTGSNGYSGATWKAASQTEPLLQLRQQGWSIGNIMFDCPTSDAAIEFIRDAAAGDAERDSSHALIAGNRFASGQEAIRITGTENVHNVEVVGNDFHNLTHAIVSAGGFAHNWFIHGNNRFFQNTNHIDVGFVDSQIIDNVFGKFTTIGIDLRGGNDNVVSKNVLSGTYSNLGGYYAGTDDEWGGNYNSLGGGVTASDPA